MTGGRPAVGLVARSVRQSVFSPSSAPQLLTLNSSLQPLIANRGRGRAAAMFILSTLSDTIFIPSTSFTRVDPSSFSSQSAKVPPTSLESLSLALNSKYSNRVIPDVGLCVCLFDVLEASEGRVKWGDGGLWHKCKFRLAVFRPFVGEVLVGRVMSSDESGIRGEQRDDRVYALLEADMTGIVRPPFPVSMGFFDDIHIPLHLLPSPHAL